MRIGTWVRIADKSLPIPRTLSTAFGLSAGSKLHVAPIFEDRERDVELIVSPVPIESWASACRLSARLFHHPGALAEGTEFLKQHNINMLLAEACVTFGGRAHWDAICDVQLSRAFERAGGTRAREYGGLAWSPRSSDPLAFPEEVFQHETVMKSCLHELNDAFKKFARSSKYFIQGKLLLAEFSPLFGLNYSYFLRSATHFGPAPFSHGSIALSDDLVKYIKSRLVSSDLPSYALVTGNTEQRYMRVYITHGNKDVMFGQIEHTPKGPGTERVGILNQILRALPPRMNLVQLSNYVVASEDGQERGRVSFLAQGEVLDKKDFEAVLSETPLCDARGNLLDKRLVHYQRLDEIPTRVFVSHRLDQPGGQLDALCKKLRSSDYEPVLATEIPLGMAEIDRESFQSIDTTVALVSLHTPNPDCKIDGTDQFMPAPWMVAEEVQAVAKGLFVLRISHERVQPFNYLKSVRTYRYSDDSGFRKCLAAVLKDLDNYRKTSACKRAEAAATNNLMKIINPEALGECEECD